MSAEDRAERQRIEDGRTRNQRWQDLLDELERIKKDPNETPLRRKKADDLWWEARRGSGGAASTGAMGPHQGAQRHRTNGDAMATLAREEGWGS